MQKIKKTALIAYPDCQLSAVLGLQDLLSIASNNSSSHDGPVFEVNILDAENIARYQTADFDAIVLPPNLSGVRGHDAPEFLSFIRNQHANGSIACSVCAGAFWLGHAQLINGRQTTTHWALEDELKTTFPQTIVNTEHILIDDNDIVTAGGLMAWLDLGLFLVHKWLGAEIVSLTARHLLIDPNGRDQKNYRSFTPPLTHGDKAILSVQHWLEGNIATEFSVKELAKQAMLADRTFLRRFKKATGLTPNTYIQNLRIEKARGMLERTRLPISEISWQVGYQDASAFSRIFKERTGLSAGDYRHRFSLTT